MEKLLERCEVLGRYITEKNATVRDCARIYGVSKSTVHKDVTERLSVVNPSLALCVRQVLEYNKAQRHIRGGLATKEKYAADRLIKQKNSL